LKLLGRIEPAQARHVAIEEYHVELRGPAKRQRRGAIHRLGDLAIEYAAVQNFLHDLPHRRDSSTIKTLVGEEMRA
jgi:hypothetical protein